MKKLTLIIATLLTLGISAGSFAQQVQQAIVPHAFKYQAVARDASGNIISSQNVSFRISIVQGSATGATVYEETQSAATNQFGLANLSIGQGNVVTGAFTDIQWGNGTYFVKIEFDPKGGTDFALMGTSQMLSVPYALYSEHSGTADNVSQQIALVATNVAQPIDYPATGLIVYNTATSGSAPYQVAPGLYYNAGTPQEANWVPVGDGSSAAEKNHRAATACSTNTTYGGTVQGAATANCVGSAAGAGSADNSAFGENAFNNTMTGTNNSTLGYESMSALTTGDYNAAVGSQAMLDCQDCEFNAVLGYQALEDQVHSGRNVAVGYQAAQGNTGEYNIAIGFAALAASAATSANTAVGYGALNFNTASDNTAVGFEALNVNVTGIANTATGYEALVSNTGSQNTAFGYLAVTANTTSSLNTGVGYEALINVTGSSNTAFGASALGSGTASSASFNTAIGYGTLFGNTTGSENTAVGYQSLQTVTTGANNTAIGYGADVSAGTYSNSTAVGSGASATASNQIRLGNNGVSSLYFGTANNLPTTANAANVYYDNTTGQFLRSTSSKRYKKDITDLKINTSLIYKLRPASYTSISDNKPHFGLIAEEVAQVVPLLAEYAKEKDVIKGSTSDSLIPDAVQYSLLSVLLLKEVQKHEKTIDSLKTENSYLKAQVIKQTSGQAQILQQQTNDEKEIAELKGALNSLMKTSASIK